MAKKKIESSEVSPAEVASEAAVDHAQPGADISLAVSSTNGVMTAVVLTPLQIVDKALSDAKIPHKVYPNSVYKDNGLAWGINYGEGSVIEIDQGGVIDSIRYSYISFDANGNFKRNN